jgi:hypothetical protein
MEDNELIAQFMGWKLVEPTRPFQGNKFENGTDVMYTVQLCYDTSWDWLMPVVEKIGKLYEANFPPPEDFMKKILAHEDPIEKEYIDVISTSIYTPIDEVYKVVVEFIKWYNKQQTV